MHPASGDAERLLDLVIAAMSGLTGDRPGWRDASVELADTLDADVSGVVQLPWSAGPDRHCAAWPESAQQLGMDRDDCIAHPLVRHYAIRRDTLARTLPDVPDGRRWRTAARFASARARLADWPHQLALPLTQRTGQVRFLGLARAGRNFTASEQAYARRVHRFLVAFDRHLQVLSPNEATCAGTTGAANGDEDLLLLAAADAHITPRELAVLTLLADGLTITAVGRRLQISPRTVTKHQENLQRKLDARDRLAMILTAQRLGLVRPPAPQRRSP